MLICVPTHKHAHTHRGGGRERSNRHKTEIFTRISIEFITGRARGSFGNRVRHDLMQTLEKADVGLLAAVLTQSETGPTSQAQGTTQKGGLPMTLLPSPWTEEVQVPEGCAAAL